MSYLIYDTDMSREDSDCALSIIQGDEMGNYESAWTIHRGSNILLGISLSFKAAFYALHRAQNTSHMVLNDLKITYSKDTGLPISTLNGTQIERVSSYKYLGIWLDENLALMST